MAYFKEVFEPIHHFEKLDCRKVRSMLKRGTHYLKMVTNQDFVVYEKNR